MPLHQQQQQQHCVSNSAAASHQHRTGAQVKGAPYEPSLTKYRSRQHRAFCALQHLQERSDVFVFVCMAASLFHAPGDQSGPTHKVASPFHAPGDQSGPTHIVASPFNALRCP
eukprot:1158271-Pelagomonas_calceolata.AAC.12